MLTVFLLLAVGWWFFPENGIQVGGVTLRFANVQKDLHSADDAASGVNVDKLLEASAQSFEETLSPTDKEDLESFRKYFTESPERIYVPEGDFTFFDAVFRAFEQARKDSTVVRILHYGDSQIELDRITASLREKMQVLFGGHGVGMVPAIETVPTFSIDQSATGSISNHIVYGNDPTQHISHRRYGATGKMAHVNGSATLSFRERNDSYTQPHVKEFSRITLLTGNTNNLTATVKAGDISLKESIQVEKGDVDKLVFRLPKRVKQATVHLQGNAEIYGVLLDDSCGVAVDNDAMRGCWGTIYTEMDTTLLAKSLKVLNTKLIILQFGGNSMPGITGLKSISGYINKLQKQITLLKRLAPQCTYLFIGPADMGKRVNGEMQTWPYLPEMNDSLKVLALRNHMAYWDMFHVMGGENSMEQWVNHNPPLGGPDYIHFSNRGAAEIGTMLANAFNTYYKFYKIRQTIPGDSVINFIRKKPVVVKKAYSIHKPVNNEKK
jgi:lysophospholipase L1-like esterase